MGLTRREIMKLGVFGGAVSLIPLETFAGATLSVADRLPESQLPAPFTVPFATPPVLDLRGPGALRTSAGEPFGRIVMSMFSTEILPGLQTRVFGYNGSVPGPTIKVNRGTPVVVRQVNSLPQVHPTLNYNPWTSVHLHGSASLPEFDGYASDICEPGQWKDYHYPNIQDARTLWYHDHGVHHTAENVSMGLAAQYHLYDSNERSLPLPKGTDFQGKDYDQPLMIQDAMFASSGDRILDNNDQSGIYGDVILVNGRPWPVMQVERRKYRFRILNASPSRSYNLSLSSGQAFTVIATDGGLMPAPQQAANIRIGMAERYEVVIDFAKYSKGARVILKNTSPKNNINYTNTGQVMAFDVVSDATTLTNNSVPAVLNPNTNTMGLKVTDAKASRTFNFVRANSHWTINGKTWADVVASNYTSVVASPTIGDVELWTLTNASKGWFHPAHIHLVDFKIVDRNGKAPFAFEKGPKDVVYLGEGESVRLLMRFGPQVGRYMMHCHNLVHEDHDMMQQFQVLAADGTNGDDPIKASPARNQPEVAP